jgi:hypothetical protein
MADDELGLEIFRAIERMRARIEVERELERFVGALAEMRWVPPAVSPVGSLRDRSCEFQALHSDAA